MIEAYAEYGAIGVIVSLFGFKSDDLSQRHREDIVKELNDVTDDLAYLKGRINGRSQ